MAPRRLAGWLIVVAGIGFTVLAAVGDWLRLGQPFLTPESRPAPTLADALPHLSSMPLEALAAAGLLVLLSSRVLPRWWSLAYAALALALLAAISRGGRTSPSSSPGACGSIPTRCSPSGNRAPLTTS